MQAEDFGALPDGRCVQRFRIGQEGGPLASVLTYGARLASLRVPVAGGLREITLGHASLAGYVADKAYLGAIVGRYANRIRDGRFVLDGREVRVSVNNGGHALHGGSTGFDRALWQAEPDGEAVVLRLRSPDGDQGFPGALDVSVRYAIEGAALVMDLTASTDAATVLNLANHAYFNLAGGGTILDHALTLHASAFMPVDAGLIPTGERRAVAGTALDFRVPRLIGERIDTDDAQLRYGQGYDHNFVLADAARPTPAPAAEVRAAGLCLRVSTTEPGIQFYSGNFLPEAGWPHRAALCLETQHFPDSPNQNDFPSTVLRPGQVFRSRTVFHIEAG